MPIIITICLILFIAAGLCLWGVLRGIALRRTEQTKEKLDDEQEKALTQLKKKR